MHKKDLVQVEDQHTFITARVEALLHVFYGNKAGRYSVKKNSKRRITDEELASMKSMYFLALSCLNQNVPMNIII